MRIPHHYRSTDLPHKPLGRLVSLFSYLHLVIIELHISPLDTWGIGSATVKFLGGWVTMISREVAQLDRHIGDGFLLDHSMNSHIRVALLQ